MISFYFDTCPLAKVLVLMDKNFDNFRICVLL